MAESAVKFLLDKLAALLEGEAKLLTGVRREVEEIKNEMESIRAFLRDADSRGESNNVVEAWVKQVKDVAYDTEDVLDEYMLHRAQHPHRNGSIATLLRKTIRPAVSHFSTSHRIATQIQEINTRVRNIKGRIERYHLISSSDPGSGSSSGSSRSDSWHDPRVLAPLFIEDSEIVGIENPKQVLIGLLVEGVLRRVVIPVVGMGGLGKTTLVRKVYENPILKRWFECCAWITVSQSYKPKDLLTSVIIQFYNKTKEPVPQGLDAMEEVQLIETLRLYLLQKRYVVVFDDVWRADLWEFMKYALPDCGCGSRIMVTTRIHDIASCLESSGYVYHLQPLCREEAWSLFCKKAFPSNTLGGNCPPELEELSRKILEKCEGLPLAIVAISGLLSKKNKKLIEWKKLHDTLGSELESNYNLTSLTRILSLSYNDLPYYLKSCFLYLSIFPEDYSIRCTRLIRLWIAEGFVKEKRDKTLEEVAEDYLDELIRRSLIQVGEINRGGKVSSCRVHDLMREIIVSKSGKENFSMMLTEQNTTLPDKIRRLSIHNSGENFAQGIIVAHLRSLFVFRKDKLTTSLFHTFVSSTPRLLKVLDLEGAPLKSFPDELVNLFHLRFLSLRKTKIEMLPRSFGNLQNLETLDLKCTNVLELPIEIVKLRKLRHLLVYHYTAHKNYYVSLDVVHGIKAPTGIGSLQALQKLAYIDAFEAGSVIGELGSLTQLRRLGIRNLRKKDGMNLCVAMEKMINLRSFDVASISLQEPLPLESLWPPPPLLQHLSLQGRLEKFPDWIASLENLIVLRLRWSRLQGDTIKALLMLPNLVHLALIQAYDGEGLCFEAGRFQKLERLSLNGLEGLKLVTIEKGAMPNLQRLQLKRCDVLQKVPLGIEHLTNLRELPMYDMPEELVKRMQRKDEYQGEDYWRVQHIPFIRHVYTKNWNVKFL
ncbi:hypothetical protein HHK36_005870 [Tetracentron sinense]|uniref:Disease resistance protein RPM1-like n=1 Tax=Tetracentron sinense TaxID=13715 RepID=A0A834ZV69_TETSI|nr:hypothetical protein HHK36_005870 [Tetracentron sinense]